MGSAQRERQRARERRRRVYVFLLEVIGVTGLIGMFPPLREMLIVTGIFVGLLAVYTLMVMQVTNGRSLVRADAAPAPQASAPGNVIRIPEIRTEPNPALEEQDRRLVRLAR